MTGPTGLVNHASSQPPPFPALTESAPLPPGTIGRFAVVKLWPEIKTAEDECIARLKIAAQAIGVECVEVHADGRALDDPDWQADRGTVDFVLHLHYDTPKRYDAFSIVALWNPLRFYHEWGYERTSRNLVTHDDFVSCLSEAADDHVTRMVRHTGTHLPPVFRLFHSTADVVHPPSLGDGKLFYAGINWEAISGGRSRHREVLRRLDGTGLLRIYGPTLFQGVRVWAGYDSYVREVPFDGISMIHEIARAGIALVLSSQAHKESGLMSNRLFESIAAGALVICDENPFAARHFGDSLLYIDSRWPADRIESTIREHLEWARSQPEEAIGKIARAQAIFRERFTLTRNLRDLYAGLPARRQALAERRHPPDAARMRVRLLLLMPRHDEAVLRQHLESARAQDWPDLSACIVVDDALDGSSLAGVERAAQAAGVGVRRMPFDAVAATGMRTPRRLGEVMLDLLPAPDEADGVIFVAPNERLLSNHVVVLAGALQRHADAVGAATAVLHDGAGPVHGVHELLDFLWVDPRNPAGLGRFIVRTRTVPSDIACALRHLHGRPMVALLGAGRLVQELPATLVIDLRDIFPADVEANQAMEAEVIRDFAPGALRQLIGHGPAPVAIHAAQPAPEATWSLLRLGRMMFNLGWVRLQWRILRQQGARARIGVLRRKLGLP